MSPIVSPFIDCLRVQQQFPLYLISWLYFDICLIWLWLLDVFWVEYSPGLMIYEFLAALNLLFEFIMLTDQGTQIHSGWYSLSRRLQSEETRRSDDLFSRFKLIHELLLYTLLLKPMNINLIPGNPVSLLLFHLDLFEFLLDLNLFDPFVPLFGQMFLMHIVPETFHSIFTMLPEIIFLGRLFQKDSFPSCGRWMFSFFFKWAECSQRWA